MQWNPFSLVIKTKEYKTSYLLGSSFQQRVVDTFHIFNGNTHLLRRFRRSWDLRKIRLGIIDYLFPITFIAQSFFAFIEKNVGPMRANNIYALRVAVLILILAPVFVLEFIKAAAALVCTLLALPLIGILHSLLKPKVGRYNKEIEKLKIIPVLEIVESPELKDQLTRTMMRAMKTKSLKEISSPDSSIKRPFGDFIFLINPKSQPYYLNCDLLRIDFPPERHRERLSRLLRSEAAAYLRFKNAIYFIGEYGLSRLTNSPSLVTEFDAALQTQSLGLGQSKSLSQAEITRAELILDWKNHKTVHFDEVKDPAVFSIRPDKDIYLGLSNWLKLQGYIKPSVENAAAVHAMLKINKFNITESLSSRGMFSAFERQCRAKKYAQETIRAIGSSKDKKDQSSIKPYMNADCYEPNNMDLIYYYAGVATEEQKKRAKKQLNAPIPQAQPEERNEKGKSILMIRP